jgi:chromosomal replication initiator protein
VFRQTPCFSPFTDACRPTDSPLISGLFSLALAPVDAAEPSVRAGPRSESAAHDERFFAGPENALVRTLAEAVLADPLDYNPIVLCGPAGVGKTSLAHALAARRRERLRLTSVVATSGADLAHTLAHAIETDSVADLRARHHRCDLLLIDDVQHLAGKSAAQQFLLSTLDTLLRRGSLVIATLRTSSGGPQATAGLLPALVSRFAGGLAVPLALPGPLARRELVRQAADRADLPLADDVIEQLAEGDGPPHRLATAARLRHAVLQLAALSQANCCAIGATQVTRLLAHESSEVKSVCRRVTAVVAGHFGLTAGELKSKSRRQTVAEARSLAMHLARRVSGASYAEIGRHFGGRDHTTVLHACRKLLALTSRDEATRRLADELTVQIAAEGGD